MTDQQPPPRPGETPGSAEPTTPVPPPQMSAQQPGTPQPGDQPGGPAAGSAGPQPGPQQPSSAGGPSGPQPGPQQPVTGAGPGVPPPGYQPTAGGYPPPTLQQPSVTPEEERNLGMIAHLAPAILLPLSAGTAGFVVSLVIFLVYKDRGPFVRAHAANSLNVQIITGIVLLLSVPLMFVLIGFITYPAALVFAVVVHVIGAMKANQGQWWNPPLTPTFVR